MNRYADPAATRELVRPDRIHRDVYLDPAVFDLEMRHLWRNAWVYVGHDSQAPKPGDFFTAQIGREPVILVRGNDSRVRVLANRCSHKGTRLLSAQQGKCAGGLLRCPYHGWTYRLDGTLRSVPLKGGYDEAAQAEALHGLHELTSHNYRGFVFVRLAAQGMGFEEFFGESLTSIDNMVDRSPEGRLEVAGGVLRYLHDCNWKMYVENLNDAMHPMVAHESSAGTAKRLWDTAAANTPKPMVIEQFTPFVNDYEFFEKMGVRVYPNGHSYTGVNFSIHSNYSAVGDYEQKMFAAYGEERAKAILAEARHNTVYYPGLTIKGAIQTIRVARPLAVDKTLIESWTFRLVGAPEQMLARTATYSRLINAPTSMVGHDDLHCYRAIQEGLSAASTEWVSLHRNYSAAQDETEAATYGATNEAPMRGQYRAWLDLMTRCERGLVNSASAIDFVYRESRLLDDKCFDEWYELFTDDGLYWMPLTRNQPAGESHTSLFYEDRLLLKVRIERLRHPNAFSQQQPSYSQHVLQQPALESGDPASGRCILRTPFLYLEAQLDQQLMLAGVAYHHLQGDAQGWKIRMKKIELLNREAALPSIQLLL